MVAEQGKDCVVARRFGVDQAGDVRVIDDLAKPYVNAAHASPFNAEYDSIDQIVMVI